METMVIPDADVKERLSRHLLVDGFEFVLDLTRSQGTTLVDARNGDTYLDMFTFFASNPLGMNHPALTGDAQFRADLLEAAMNKPSNSDILTEPYARFVDTFARVVGMDELPHYFFIDGGGLAVENALKVAFDWKSRWNETHGIGPDLGTRVLHLEHAFHGRTGYTMSLTNTDPVKVARFPKFDWPRISSPHLTGEPADDMDAAEARTLAEARAAFEAHPDDIACFIMEPIQCEGGDHHFRAGFVRQMCDLCHEHDALFIVDEVQTGGGMTGRRWAHQLHGVQPDIVAFGKKLQVCGIMAGGRVDEVPDNVFHTSSRLNSTWGGNLADMVRSRRMLEVIEDEDLVGNAAVEGDHLLGRLTELTGRHDLASHARGAGLLCALSMPSRAVRDEVLRRLLGRRVVMLGCGDQTVRVRPPLTVTRQAIDQAVDTLDEVLAEVAHA